MAYVGWQDVVLTMTTGEPLSMESAAEVLATLIREHANGGKAVVFGYSMGGYIAMAFAGRYPDLCAYDTRVPERTSRHADGRRQSCELCLV